MIFPNQIAAYVISALQVTDTQLMGVIVLVVIVLYFAVIFSAAATLTVYVLKNKNEKVLKSGCTNGKSL